MMPCVTRRAKRLVATHRPGTTSSGSKPPRPIVKLPARSGQFDIFAKTASAPNG